jgi:DICT domain-containing protein
VNNIQFANNNECAQRRKVLISAGIIKENPNNLVIRKETHTVSTKAFSQELKRKFISEGILDQNYIKISKCNESSQSEEGAYEPTLVKNDEQYLQKKTIYFRMLQEILVARRELDLTLGPKLSSDPDWFF